MEQGPQKSTTPTIAELIKREFNGSLTPEDIARLTEIRAQGDASIEEEKARGSTPPPNSSFGPEAIRAAKNFAKQYRSKDTPDSEQEK